MRVNNSVLKSHLYFLVNSEPATDFSSEERQEVEVDGILSFPNDLTDHVDLVTALTEEEISGELTICVIFSHVNRHFL
jgi:hypothetical protein